MSAENPMTGSATTSTTTPETSDSAAPAAGSVGGPATGSAAGSAAGSASGPRPDDFTVRLEEVFQGPMDLLLHLVKEQEVEIQDADYEVVERESEEAEAD